MSRRVTVVRIEREDAWDVAHLSNGETLTGVPGSLPPVGAPILGPVFRERVARAHHLIRTTSRNELACPHTPVGIAHRETDCRRCGRSTSDGVSCYEREER